VSKIAETRLAISRDKSKQGASTTHHDHDPRCWEREVNGHPAIDACKIWTKIVLKEAPTLWNGTPHVDIALSVGTGSAEDRVAEKNRVSQYVLQGWLKQCVDLFESNLEAERLWRKYHDILDEEAQPRHHRLNVKLTGTLPFMADTRHFAGRFNRKLIL
jgi:hypothetical protein